MNIVRVKNNRAAVPNCRDEFALRTRNILNRAQKFNVRLAYVGYNAECLNLPKPAHTDFNDGGFMILVERKQSHRHADFVIKIARSLLHVS